MTGPVSMCSGQLERALADRPTFSVPVSRPKPTWGQRAERAESRRGLAQGDIHKPALFTVGRGFLWRGSLLLHCVFAEFRVHAPGSTGPCLKGFPEPESP